MLIISLPIQRARYGDQLFDQRPAAHRKDDVLLPRAWVIGEPLAWPATKFPQAFRQLFCCTPKEVERSPATRISHREMTHLQHQQVFVASQSCVPAAKALADIEVPIGRMVHWCTSNGKAPAMFPGG
jgi:hypothetical protein